MKRFIYSIPLFVLLVPWLFIVAVIFGVGYFVTWHALLLLVPVATVFAAAHYVHRRRTACEQHFVAALFAAAVLAAPLVAIVAAFFSWGRPMAEAQAERLFGDAIPFERPAPPQPDCELVF